MRDKLFRKFLANMVQRESKMILASEKKAFVKIVDKNSEKKS